MGRLSPGVGSPYFAALIYLRLSDTLHIDYGLPSLFMFVAPAMLLLAVGRWLVTGARAGRGWQSAAFLLVLYGAICSGSLLYAVNQERTTEALMNYVDGIFIVLVLTLSCGTSAISRGRSPHCSSAGSSSPRSPCSSRSRELRPHLRGPRARERTQHLRRDRRLPQRRACIANYFALVLIIAVPLAVDWLVRERRLAKRLAGAGAGRHPRRDRLHLLTRRHRRTRGHRAAMAAWIPRPKRMRWAVAAGGTALVGAALVAPTDYGQRLAALGQVADVVHGDAPSESALRGRLSEVTSAALMFVDHPVIGVGYGNFEEYYHRYARGLALDGRREERQAHSLYLEVAAETGVMGLLAFAALLAYPIAGLLRVLTRGCSARAARDAQRVAAFGISLFGYLMGSLFLHLSYPRYFWLLLGIALGVAALRDESSRARAGRDMRPQMRIALRRLRTRRGTRSATAPDARRCAARTASGLVVLGASARGRP